jgi:hypothetical protein
MERARFIEYRGIPILLSDLSWIQDTQELQRAIRLGGDLMQMQPPESTLVLVDVTGVEYNVENFAVMQQSVAVNRPYVRARAIVGLSPLAGLPFEIVAKLSAMPMAKFDDRVAAMDWLVSHASG